jgi:hypothetical protein
LELFLLRYQLAKERVFYIREIYGRQS